MSEPEDPLYNVLYSLPVLGSSVAISTRTPSAGYSQSPKYMPDYGGVLEIPDSNIKNNSLNSKLPFQARSILRPLCRFDSPGIEQNANLSAIDHLSITSCSDLHNESQFTVIQTLGNELRFELVTEKDGSEADEAVYSSIIYFQKSSEDRIAGIKCIESAPDVLLVKFEESFEINKLNTSYSDIALSDNSNTQFDRTNSQSPIESVTPILDDADFYAKDVCSNCYNKSIFGLASDNSRVMRVKLYDVSSSSPTQPFYAVSWSSDDDDSNLEVQSNARKKPHLTFIPSKPATRGVQQFDHIPHHLVNMVVTTGSKIAVVDPRVDQLGQVYADRSKIPSFYPIEYFRKTEFSQRNSYQFYSLSDVHIRVFDTRFKGVPLNQTFPSESMCISVPDRLCFATFDQASQKNLVNPKSSHIPYHALNSHGSPQDGPLLSGLAIKLKRGNRPRAESFAVIQSSKGGILYSRSYTTGLDSDALDYASNELSICRQDRTNRSIPNGLSTDLDYRDIVCDEPEPDNKEYLDILDEDVLGYGEDMFGSKRAYERFEKMKLALGN